MFIPSWAIAQVLRDRSREIVRDREIVQDRKTSRINHCKPSGVKVTKTSNPNPTFDAIFNPQHYQIEIKGIGHIECCDIIDALRERWKNVDSIDIHRLSSAFEYLFRLGSKDDSVTDAEKALNHLHRAIHGTWVK